MRPDLALFASLMLSTASAGIIDLPIIDTHVAHFEAETRDAESDTSKLWKRRGGGGGGGRGGGGSSSGGSRGSSSGSSGSSGGGSRGGSSSSSSSGGGTNTYTSSVAGGYSKTGTGPQPAFAGGKYYGGGAKVPFPAGGSPPGRSLKPYPIYGGGLAFWPGYWPYGAYMYPYAYTYHYRNATSDKDEEREVLCGCAEYSVCGCDDIDDVDFYKELIKDGDYGKLNKTLVNVAEVNGTMKILINGTLPNGTTVRTHDSGASRVARTLGLWPAVAAVAATVFVI